ncbi:hypothetical protein PLICRDRAFT_179709 [Plicaturopsis crispa FD-325 SS-3]|uniref:Unplaced genomic scaffold PLICRscaffold_18, whole genome shotgun sequence n=1 Tax=Plicaturopsis crispa FD-325 SS-3 TaxID=944288 RepID=A0A0C9T8E7_PLICR|nr:hypothetical protein PLICRDRAFT_179709 [Plicaturopsis crispa FD-325 SS-3]
MEPITSSTAYVPVWKVTSKDLLRDYRLVEVDDRVVGVIRGSMHGALSGVITEMKCLVPGTYILTWILDEPFGRVNKHFVVVSVERPHSSIASSNTQD